MEFRSWFVRSFVRWCPPFLFCTVLLYSSVVHVRMCSKQTHKADHGHKTGHAPRAIQRHSPTGISRPRTEVLRTCTYFSAANTLLRSRASRGHLNLYSLLNLEAALCTDFCGHIKCKPSLRNSRNVLRQIFLAC